VFFADSLIHCPSCYILMAMASDIDRITLSLGSFHVTGSCTETQHNERMNESYLILEKSGHLIENVPFMHPAKATSVQQNGRKVH
jgi:hypothetical protein